MDRDAQGDQGAIFDEDSSQIARRRPSALACNERTQSITKLQQKQDCRRT